MSLCRKCNDNIPNNVVIDGKKRNLQRRKYCIKCSPFGGRNTKVDIDAPSSKISIKNGHDLDKFVELECKHHGLTIFVLQKCGYCCRKCRNSTVTKNRKKRKLELVEFFGGKCKICGYDKCMEALDFHHIDPNQKEFGISREGLAYSFERRLKEAKKCILICCRCHRELENGIIKICQDG